jgi:hypothetical protein
MIPEEKEVIQSDCPESDVAVKDEENTLILLRQKTKRNLDQSISNSEKYKSWYHYRTTDVDKYLQLCPHCKKPTLSAFEKTVIDSATDYLNGKRLLASPSKSRGNFLQSFIIMLAFCSVVYFIVNRI